ncbi:hypothetical protein EYF80_015352 [Liparis tanakae]|uniref:Uncharacterized protein n=1 Tax=Liparis tanakae TaxID=230148 RepID=A0A4Z2IBB9_9TELE|nr:hypothetical protein EYF80_015352 [Liparis tanakae]
MVRTLWAKNRPLRQSMNAETGVRVPVASFAAQSIPNAAIVTLRKTAPGLQAAAARPRRGTLEVDIDG